MGLDTFTRRAIAIGALMAGAAIFYHYVIFIPSVERTKQAQLESDKKEAELRVTKRAQDYEYCKETARISYNVGWYVACSVVAKDRKLQYENCLKDPSVMSNPLMGKQYCNRTYGKTDSSSVCEVASSAYK